MLPVEPRPIFGAPGVLTGQDRLEAKKQVIPVLPSVSLGLPYGDEIERKPADSNELADAIRAFLKSKAAYRALEFSLKDRCVYLKADDQNVDALHEAARGISRLPHVEGVILLDKTSPR
jgi:hypothetical protein